MDETPATEPSPAPAPSGEPTGRFSAAMLALWDAIQKRAFTPGDRLTPLAIFAMILLCWTILMTLNTLDFIPPPWGDPAYGWSH